VSSILIAENDPVAGDRLAGWLGQAGYVCETAPMADALTCAREQSPDAVLVSIGTTDDGSLWVLRALNAQPDGAATLALTRGPSVDLALEARRLGAIDCLPWPSSRTRVLESVQRAVTWRAQVRDAQHRLDSLREEVARGQARLQELVRNLSAYVATQTLVASVEEQSADLAEHAHRVARSSVALSEALGLSRGDVRTVRTAALLEDLGKLAMPASLLKSNRPLSDDEMFVMRSHVVIAAEVLRGVSGLESVADLVLCSRERFDGRGYPAGRRGAAIPLGARIIAVADAYDMLTSPRTSLDPLSHDGANAELVRRAGAQFDPDVVGAWLDLTERARCC
jgi:response regulator RpfG family c-di-GMP phosphodiesterase